VFYPAKAKIFRNGRYVEVSAPEVESPVAVRYAFKNVPEWSLYNAAGMPVSSFRTDDWTDATYKE
jgi:sialate O-acetylesterase